MNEIASQYEPDVYDQYSRKVVGGKTVIKTPGQKVQMSRTRMKYLQRHNKSQAKDIEEESHPIPEASTVLRESNGSPSKVLVNMCNYIQSTIVF